jgi:hypothetical protein
MAFREHPGYSIHVDHLIKTPKGKIRRKKLKASRSPLATGGSVNENFLWLQAGGR